MKKLFKKPSFRNKKRTPAKFLTLLKKKKQHSEQFFSFFFVDGILFFLVFFSTLVYLVSFISDGSLTDPEIKPGGEHLKALNPAQVPKPILPHPKDHAAAEVAHHRQSEFVCALLTSN